MKILRIELKDNPILGSIKLDFINDNGKAYDNVVFAGENWCGKTCLLNIIFEFSNMIINSNMSKTEKRTFYIRLTREDLSRFNNNSEEKLPSDVNVLKIDIDGSHQPGNRISINPYDIEKESILKNKRVPMVINKEYKDIFKTIFSTAEISYAPEPSKGITSMELDEDFISSKRSGSSLADEIQQLLIDVQANDATMCI